MWTRFLQTWIERSRRVTQTFERHRAGNIGNICQAFPMQDRQSPDRMHGLSAVQQRETFFGLQLQWLKFRPLKRFATIHPVSGKERFAFADQTQSEMRQWREIATCTDRAFFRNNWMHAPIKHLTKQLNNFRANAAESKREDVCAQQHHRANFRLR